MPSKNRPQKQKIDTERSAYKLLSTSECAALLSVHSDTIRRWCDQGYLSFTRTGGGRRWISMSEVERIRSDNAYSTVSDAIQRMEDIINAQNDKIRDLISEKSGVITHNFEVIDKRIDLLTEAIDRLQPPPTR